MADTYNDVLTEYLKIPPKDRKEGSEIDRALMRFEREQFLQMQPGAYRQPGLIMPEEPRFPMAGLQSFIETYGPSFDDDEILDRITSPTAPNNRHHSDKFTLDQDGRGSCAAEGLTGNIMCMRDEMTLPLIKLNPWPLYWLSSGGRDSGSSLQANIRHAIETGIPSQEVIPRNGSYRRMNDTELQNAARHRLKKVVQANNLREAKSLLSMSRYLYLGYSGHAWFGVKGLDLLRLVWKNSWGSDWGDNGHGTLSWSQVMQGYGMYCPIEIFVPDDEVTT